MTQPATVRRSIPRAAPPRPGGGQTALGGCFGDAPFVAAVHEMEALGLRVTTTAHPGSIPFDVLPGRAHLRWFLMPAQPRKVRLASLALIQPLRPAARLFKQAMAVTATLGLPALWRQGRVHVSGIGISARSFDAAASQAAFLTGTAGPHRKLTVQWMDGRGRITGYAKVSRAPAVQALLANEASVLDRLRKIGLHTALVPRARLREGSEGDATILATNTVRTPRHSCCTSLHPSHLLFLEELAVRTASPEMPDGDGLLRGLRAQVANLATALSAKWRQRFERALQGLAFAPDLVAPRGLAHGDFTPINTFRYQDRVFVFDWEYAGYAYPADYDLIRFLFAIRSARRANPADACIAIETILTRELGRSPAAARARLAAYLCAQALMLAGRRSVVNGNVLNWEGERAMASMLDALGARGRVP